jgi:hypothetical protein
MESVLRRATTLLATLACLIALPPVAAAATAAAPVKQATGTIITLGWSSFTIQTPGKRVGMINALTTAANAVTTGDYPYVWGGGHGEAGVASVGSKGPGHNGRRIGYDCSGAVAAVLAGAGLWQPGAGVPNDAGVIKLLLQEGLIARGAGNAPDEVTLYDDPGVHIFMNIDGRFFGTSDGGGGGNPKGGAGWLDDGAPDSGARAFKRYHVLPSVLKDKAIYGHSLTFQIDPNASIDTGFELGDHVQVGYSASGSGSMVASALTWVGAVTTTGTVTSIAADGSSFTIAAANGSSVTFSTGTATSLVSGLQVGDTVQVISIKTPSGAPVARAVTITATVTPTVSQATGTILSIAGDASSFTIETSDGQQLSFSTGGQPSLIDNYQAGQSVQVDYTASAGGTIVAQSVTAAGSGPSGGGPYGWVARPESAPEATNGA